MLRTTLAKYLDSRQKRALKTKLHQVRQKLVKSLRSYDASRLTQTLRQMGIAETDTLLVHSNFEPLSGFTGTPMDVVDAFANLVGDRGNLAMVSIPFRGSAYDYLAQGKVFDVRKTFSMMGLITEMFRRRPGTLRSLHPTHPVLALGKDAAWIVEGHENCLYPCGPGSPFEKLHALNGKIVFFDVGFGSITFFHYVEHLTMPDLPFPVYDSRVFEAPVVDSGGQRRIVRTQAYTREYPRAAEKLEAEMIRRGKIKRGRVGNSRLLLVNTADVVECQTSMVKAGNYPYSLQHHE
jgi:aminoglycoside 3-N-acetyltransferase